MARLAREGSGSEFIGAIAENYGNSLDSLDIWLRNHYVYRSENEEIVRAIPAMEAMFFDTGYVEGDCDDIATFTASILRRMGYRCRFVAIRSDAANPEYTHVFVECISGGNTFIFDATVPIYRTLAGYTTYSRMVQYV